jgi:flagellar hook-associated protein 2
MGSITTGVGLISGINTAQLIDQLIALESRGKVTLQERVAILQAQKTAMLDINARLLAFKNIAHGFRINKVFGSSLATSSNADILSATATSDAQPGTYAFVVKQIVSNSQVLSKGFADSITTPLGLTELSFEFGNGRLNRDRDLDGLNGGAGVRRGKITITDTTGTKSVDLSDVATVNEVVDRINASGANVTAQALGDRLVVSENSAGAISIANAPGSFTASDLGLAGSAVGTLTGSVINSLGTATALQALNDGNGVFTRNNLASFRIQVNGGTIHDIDLGRVDEPITAATSLEDLNDGAGVKINTNETAPDFRIITHDGTTVDIKLGQLVDSEGEVTDEAVETVGELITRVNSQLQDALGHTQVQLAISPGTNQFVLTDASAGATTLQVIGGGPNLNETAEDLGLLAIDGGSGDLDAAPNQITGAVLKNTVETPAAQTIQDIITRVNEQTGGAVTVSVAADGVSLQFSAGAGNTITMLSGVGDGSPFSAQIAAQTLRDLGFVSGQSATNTVAGGRVLAALDSVLVKSLHGGAGITPSGTTTLTGATLLSSLFNGQGISPNGSAASPDIRVQLRDGSVVNVEVDGLTTVQELIDAFNAATGGQATMSISGQALEIANTSIGLSNFQVGDINGSSVVSELGLGADLNLLQGNTVTGVDTQPQAGAALQFTNRLGAITTVNLTTTGSLSDIIAQINSSGAGVTASINATGNGLLITDTTGGSGSLVIAGSVAASLGIATAGVSSNTVNGTNLQLRYVSEGSLLKNLNYGKGIGTGSFTITDGYGESAVVDVASDSITLYDVINEINTRGLALTARVNDTGDGLVIEEDLTGQTTTPFVAIKITNISGTTASDLNILGASTTITGASIDGSYERTVALEAGDSLSQVIKKLNDAKVPIAASVINTGSGAAPFRLSLTSLIGGSAGDLVIDTHGVDLGLTPIAEGRDAKVFFGSADLAQAQLIRSSTNSLDELVQGVTIDLHKASDELVTLTVARDTAAITKAMGDFAATFTDAVGTIDRYDFFDVDTEERGVLLGNSVTARTRDLLFRTVQQKATGVTGPFQTLSQIGVKVGPDSTLIFDEAKFLAAYEQDPEAVEDLMAGFESTIAQTQEIAPGVTVTTDEETFSVLGIGETFDQMLEGLTNSIDGSLTIADQNFQELIDLTNERIEAFDEKLERKRQQLEAQFIAMETALAKLQGQAGALTSLAGNILLAQRRGQVGGN